MTVASSRVRRRGLHREVVDVLGQRIVRGDYQPGEALPNESELGLTLERANWSLIDPDVLTWQVDVAADIGLFRALSEVRSIIEPQAAGLAASRRTAAEAERLLELLSELDSAAEDTDRYVAADLELHAAILRATHNELLAQMTGTIRVTLDASRRISVRVPGGPRGAMPLHRDVVLAIRNGDAIAARDAMTDLITGTARDIEAVFGKDGGGEGRL